MRAQLLTAFGGVEGFDLAEVPDPVPRPGEVRVRVAVIGVNGLETKIRTGRLEDRFPTPLPAILGKEFAGTVDQVGEGVTDLAIGDRVAGFSASGAYAALAVARREAVARLPDGLRLLTAAALPVAVETATRGIDALRVVAGWTVVVNGATGGVGSAAVQLLRMRGANVVGTTSARNLDHLAGLGAVPVTYGEGVGDRIRTVARKGVDAVFDVAGHGFARVAVELTGDPSRVVTIADFARRWGEALLRLSRRTSRASVKATTSSPRIGFADTSLARVEAPHDSR